LPHAGRKRGKGKELPAPMNKEGRNERSCHLSKSYEIKRPGKEKIILSGKKGDYSVVKV